MSFIALVYLITQIINFFNESSLCVCVRVCLPHFHFRQLPLSQHSRFDDCYLANNYFLITQLS